MAARAPLVFFIRRKDGRWVNKNPGLCTPRLDLVILALCDFELLPQHFHGLPELADFGSLAHYLDLHFEF